MKYNSVQKLISIGELIKHVVPKEPSVTYFQVSINIEHAVERISYYEVFSTVMLLIEQTIVEQS